MSNKALISILLAIAILPFVNALAKYLSDYPVVQVSWARYAGHFVLMAILMLFTPGKGSFHSSHLSLQLLRSSLHCFGVMVNFFVLAFISLSTASAISFLTPLIVAALAPLALKEQVTKYQWIAIGVGFLGTLIVVRPVPGGENWAVGLLVVNAFAAAIIQILSRKLSFHDSPVTSNTYLVLVGFVALSLPLPFIWVAPETVLDIAAFVAIGLAGGLGHYLLVRAFELAPAAVVSPFTYGQIMGAVLLGYTFFGQLPDIGTLIGASIIVGSGICLLRLARK